MIRSGRLPAGRLVTVGAGQPSRDVAVPAAVILLAAGRPIRPVWQNERGGLTFTVGDAGPAHEGAISCFVKWAPVGCGINLDDEAARLTWAAAFTAVPRLLDHGEDGLDTALQRVSDVPPMDRLVVCHGDACAPNTLVGDDGTWSGHVDLGALGRADRWADLAVATWSTEWNFGPGWDGLLLDAYGIAADPGRISYYRLLWDLGD